MRFRPCIDLRGGKVVQIIGGTLTDTGEGVTTNFTAKGSPGDFARRYGADQLTGGHVIALGPGNEDAAKEALGAWPGGLQYGGGVTDENATSFLDAGASHVIVTSWIFHDGILDQDRLARLTNQVGKNRLVLDLSCRRKNNRYFVVTDRWQTFSSLEISADTLASLSEQCSEILVHGVDVEGLQAGIEEELVETMGRSCNCPVTYAGGVRNLMDMDRINELGSGVVDATIGSALDIFGGKLAYTDVIAWHRKHNPNG